MNENRWLTEVIKWFYQILFECYFTGIKLDRYVEIKIHFMKKLFFCLSILFIFSSCSRNSTSAETEISSKINTLYAGTESSSKDLFSTDLQNLLDEAHKVADADAERVKKSSHPTDKPAMVESFIFTGIPDATTQKVKKITVKDNTAEASVEMKTNEEKIEGKTYPATVAESTIKLINDKGWKIDNIIFTEQPTLQDQLKDFISETKKGL